MKFSVSFLCPFWHNLIDDPDYGLYNRLYVHPTDELLIMVFYNPNEVEYCHEL